MSKRPSILIVMAVFALLASCAPSDPPPPSPESVPDTTDEGTIKDMDFESGEVEEKNVETDPEPTPETEAPH